MRRAAIAAAWVAGTTLPLLAAVVFIFGCCVLPFHATIHKLMPLCEMAMNVIRGEQSDPQAGAQQPLPARETQEPAKRLATQAPRSFQLDAPTPLLRAAAPADLSAYRSFISLGALRCDQDVGLHLLGGTLLI
jgi:hypothetical protein